MSDVVDGFKALREIRKRESEENRKSAPSMLSSHGIRFQSNNQGLHLIVFGARSTIDFWPGTGLWKVRGNGKQPSNYSIETLIEFVESSR